MNETGARRLRQSSIDVIELTAVAEAIGRDVQDAHDVRAFQVQTCPMCYVEAIIAHAESSQKVISTEKRPASNIGTGRGVEKAG